MINMKNYLLAFMVLLSAGIRAQTPNIASDHISYELLQDCEIQLGRLSNSFHLGIKPLQRGQVLRYLDEVRGQDSTSRYMQGSLRFLERDNALLRDTHVFESKRKVWFPNNINLFALKNENYSLVVNPVFNVGFGSDRISTNNFSYNTRGVEIYGTVFKKIGFYSYTTDNIVMPLNYVKEYVGMQRVFPTANLTKGIPGGGYNFLQSRGYVSYAPIQPLSFQFGHDRQFIGDGVRSFIMSDFGREFLFAKANFNHKKVNFMFLGGQMINQYAPNWQNMAEKKYMATHHLSINLGKKLNVGLFETVVFSRTDSNGNNSGFDFSYANPLAFFRVVEHGLNSSDNAMLGMNYKYLPFKKVMVYGQLVLDEFKLDEVLSDSGWYGNKYALQAGVKVVSPFKWDGLSLRFEYNRIRPYTFMHFNRAQSLVHNNIPLSHPLGANFEEFIFVARYAVNSKLVVSVNAMYYKKGYDKGNKNYGGDIANKEYLSAVSIYGNYIGQGQLASVHFVETHVAYALLHNLFVDVSVLYRNSVSDSSKYHYGTQAMSLGLRYNIGRSNFMML